MSNFIIPEKIRYLWGSHYTTPNWESRRNLSLPEFKRLREKQKYSKVIDQIENCVKWTCANFCMKKAKGTVTNPSLVYNFRSVLEIISVQNLTLESSTGMCHFKYVSQTVWNLIFQTISKFLSKNSTLGKTCKELNLIFWSQFDNKFWI